MSEDDVGYKKPPQHTQFKTGVSGNPKGRPKGAANVTTVIQRALRQRVTVTVNGQRKKMSKFDAAVTQLTNVAASGNIHALKQLIPLALLVEQQQKAAPSPEVEQKTNEADTKTLENLMKRFERLQKGKGK